jgi:hypothetical protein
MSLSGVAGDVRARTENGPLSVHLTGAQWRGAKLDASTENGPVSLALPRAIPASSRPEPSTGRWT